MIRIREFIKSGGHLSDPALIDMMRAEVRIAPAKDQRDWLRQVELSLDGYGAPSHVAAAERIRIALKDLEKELPLAPLS